MLIGETLATRSVDRWFPLTDDELTAITTLPARQQPEWGEEWLVDKVRTDLAAMPGLVEWDEVRSLHRTLAEVAAGRTQVIQAGDCAEDPAECVPDVLSRKLGLLEALGGAMRLNTRTPVVRVGRFAGQFAKPRSAPTERHGDVELPVFRGHLVNDPRPDEAARRPDPLRMLDCYRAAANAMRFLRQHTGRWSQVANLPVWTSHEALVLDYELPLVRRSSDGRLLLASTHWPWVGDRTRQLDGAHVALLAAIDNPVACKVGPTMTPAELVALCERLDPHRVPGRLTLISRTGADRVTQALPPLVRAVRAEGHPVIWLCDPMHGNTVRAADGRKTRLVDTIVREVTGFQAAVAEGGGVAGGLHLETTPELVTECVADSSRLDTVGETGYTTACDPRLNPVQALTVARAWSSVPGTKGNRP